MKEKDMKMDRISDMATAVFFAKQGQLFDEPVAETEEEAREFLEDCLAVVVPSIAHVRKYLDESGMDVTGLTTRRRSSRCRTEPFSSWRDKACMHMM